MARIEKFEDLECWKEARVLVTNIYKDLESNHKIDLDTKSQMRRAVLSIMNNIAEGFGRISNKEFVRFLGFSTSSANEVKSMLYVLSDLEYLSPDQVNEFHQQVDKTKHMILGLIRYLNSKL